MILIIAEQRDGVLNRASWETVAAAQSAGAQPIKVAVLGTGDAAANEIAAAEVAEVLVVDDPSLEPYTPDGFAQALAALIDAEKPDLVFLPHTYQTRDFAPKLAAQLDRVLVTDCVGMKTHEGAQA